MLHFCKRNNEHLGPIETVHFLYSSVTIFSSRKTQNHRVSNSYEGAYSVSQLKERSFTLIPGAKIFIKFFENEII
jgi:hypothetical protein